MRVFTQLVAIWSFYILKQNVEALTCLRCDYVVQPRHCQTVISCPEDDSCFVERQTNAFGEIGYSLGCLAKRMCTNSTNSLNNCTLCCDKDMCNHAGCGEEGYPIQRGPVCYSCANPLPEGRCHSIDVCREGEVCSLNGHDMFGTILYTSGCMQKDHCVSHPGGVLIGKRSHVASTRTRSNGLHDCFRCCNADLCNNNCQTRVDGQWSSWTAWSLCSSHCNQNQTRACNNPAPIGDGRDCPGLTTQTQGCYTDQCRIDGQWGSWTAWSLCTPHCNQTRTRACNNPAPQHDVRDCPGLSTQTQGCYADQCRVEDCSQLLSTDASRHSGVYTITTHISHTKIPVYCDMETDGGGWTVFQRRFDGSVDFYRTFIEYENGFGNISGEHWLGLKYISEITSKGFNKLRLDVTHFNGSKGHDVYGNFSLEPGTNYILNLGANLQLSGISSEFQLNSHVPGAPVGCGFSTYDHDVDKVSTFSCAIQDHGGWWYNSCYLMNINGRYRPGVTSADVMRFAYREGLNASFLMFKRT
ncbi:SCO-spondin-like isoform X2 [Dreissena polymorpha]|nr:SCO-spondin-like isoform X2 [Dreissena polymorpha]XP_052286421.1 SCO-spondin-like isoform X2 [Dreissena polymorpha]